MSGGPATAVPQWEPGRATAAATLALAGLTVAAAVGMGRLFEGSSYLVPLLCAAAVGHGAMWAGRRLAVALPVSAAAAMGGAALASAWLLFPETTTFGVPGPRTLDTARLALAAAWTEFGEVVSPAPASDGFLLSAMVGVVVTSVLADWAAFRMRALFEAIVPSFTLFVFTAILGASERRGLMVALYLAALLLFLVLHNATLESVGTSWFASRTPIGPEALFRGAALLAAVAVVAAVVVGPRLPGASAEALLTWRDSDRPGDGRRTTVSPLVDIRGRLVDQSTTEVFSVRTDRRAYWRLTSLDTFDGQIWSSDASYRPVKRRFPPARRSTPPVDRVVQEFTIRSLSSIWLPAAYRPEAVRGIDDVSYNEDLGSLITGEDTTDGLTYTVESAIPRLNGSDLKRAQEEATSPEMDRFRRFPPVSRRVLAETRRIAAGSDGTPYGKALALQAYFRESGFIYDLNARPGHDARALENFLFGSRRGYCEQFAGAFAAMGRAMGLPTRVAVGFTPGEPGRDGRLHVKGLNAHAWPEVFITGFGWVAFEPTPGRGAPGAESYLGVPEAQARAEDPSTATTAAPTSTTAADDLTTSASSVPEDVEADGAATDDDRPLRRHPLVVTITPVLLAALVLACAIPLAKESRRRRRRSRAASPGDRVWVAWSEAADALGRVGAPRRPAETLDEHACRAAPAAGLPADVAVAMAQLASDAAAASYAAGPVLDEAADRAARHAAAVEHHITSRASKRQRLVWTIDPRPLLPRRGGRGPEA